MGKGNPKEFECSNLWDYHPQGFALLRVLWFFRFVWFGIALVAIIQLLLDSKALLLRPLVWSLRLVWAPVGPARYSQIKFVLSYSRRFYCLCFLFRFYSKLGLADSGQR